MSHKPVRSPRIDERYTCYRLEIRESKIHRLGIYTLEGIPANRKVIEYTGEKLNRLETKRRNIGNFTYLFKLDNYHTIDGAVGGSGAEVANHCCEPNLRVLITRGHILYMSMRAIRAGEELTIDYRFTDDEERVKCSCGAAKCRGTINLKRKQK